MVPTSVKSRTPSADKFTVDHEPKTECCDRPVDAGRRARRLGLKALAILIFVGASAFSTIGSGAASTTLVITATVPSAVTMTDNCDDPSAYGLGTVQPNSRALTATDADVCSIQFSSTNDNAMLRMSQHDQDGTAMSAPDLAWQDVVAPFDVGASAVHAANASVLMAAADYEVLHSLDGGVTWNPLTLPGSPWIVDVSADPLNADVWYAVGSNGSVYRTNNGQVAAPVWANQTPQLALGGWPAAAWVMGVAIGRTGGAATVFVVGSDWAGDGWVARSSNAGATWTAFAHTDPDVDSLYTVDAVTATEAYAAGDYGAVLHTVTGAGNSAAWPETTPNGCWAWDIATPASNRVYVATDCGLLIWNGAIWDTVNQWEVGHRTEVHTVGASPAAPNVVWAAGREGIAYRSINAGVTIDRLQIPTSEIAEGLAVIGPGTTAVMSGKGRILLRSTDAGVTWSERFATAAASGFDGAAASPIDGRRMLVVGNRGEVRRSDDGGDNWTSPASGTSEALLDVDFANDDVAWAVGTGGTVLKSNDSGATWAPQSSGISARLQSIDAIDSARAVIVGSDGTVLVTTTGGAGWAQQTSGVPFDLLGVVHIGNGSGTIVAGGVGDTMILSTDFGATFTPATAPPTGNTVALGIGPGSTLLAATTMSLWTSSDGGDTWQPTGPAFASMGLSSLGSSILRAGDYGELQRSVDTGATFDQVNSNRYILDVASVDANTAIAVGLGHTIRRTTPELAALAAVADKGVAPANWASATGNMFGVCVQAVSAGTAADWVVDTVNSPGQCQATDADPWRNVPTTPDRVATAALGNFGRVDLVWGFRPAPDQLPSAYSAGVVFEVLAPVV